MHTIIGVGNSGSREKMTVKYTRVATDFNELNTEFTELVVVINRLLGF